MSSGMCPLKISVVIPTYNRRDVLSRTLPTIFHQDIPADKYEVVVVVDGSTDGTAAMLRGLETRCTLRVIEQANRGQAAARNAGLQAARGEIVLFLDDDILCSPSLLRDHLASRDGVEALCVYGPVVPAAENDLPSSRARLKRSRSDEVRRHAPQTDPPLPDGEDAWATPNLSAPRSLLLAAGGYDERYGRSREDLDLVLRLRKMGAQFRFQSSAVGSHLCVKSAREMVTEAASRSRSEILLCRTHPEYRPYSLVAKLAEGPTWKYQFRQTATRLPVSPEPLLRLLFRVADWRGGMPGAERLATGLHSAQCSIAFRRSALREAGSWEALRREFGGTGIELSVAGVLPPEQVVQALALADVLLFVRGGVSSRRGSALAGIACELPVVGYRSEETAFPVTEAGVVLVPLEDRRALGEALTQVLADDDWRKQLRARSRVVQEQHLSWEAISRSFLQLLNQGAAQ